MKYRIALECVDHDDNGVNGFESALIQEQNHEGHDDSINFINKNMDMLNNRARQICKEQNRPAGTYQINHSNEGSRAIGKSLGVWFFNYKGE